MSRKNHAGLGKLCPALQQAIELAVALQLIEPPDGSDDTLPAPAFFPVILDDLEINVIAGTLLAEKHDGLGE